MRLPKIRTKWVIAFHEPTTLLIHYSKGDGRTRRVRHKFSGAIEVNLMECEHQPEKGIVDVELKSGNMLYRVSTDLFDIVEGKPIDGSPRMITNLQDLCDYFHADEPRLLNHRIYKDTDCGASISIHIGPKPVVTKRRLGFVFASLNEQTMLICVKDTDKGEALTYSEVDALGQDIIHFFGLERDNPSDNYRTEKFLSNFDNFQAACHEFQHEQKTYRNKTRIESCSFENEQFTVIVTFEEVEDNSRMIHNGDTIQDGTRTECKYVHCPQCGHLNWPQAKTVQHPDDPQEDVYFGWQLDCEECDFCQDMTEEQATCEVPRHVSAWDIPVETELLGFTIQSIVENSDVEVNGDYMEVPIPAYKVRDWMAEMERQTSFYWERDNWLWVKFKNPDGEMGCVEQTWEGWNWDEDRHSDICLELREAIEGMFSIDPEVGSRPVKYGEDRPVPGFEGWVAQEYMNDCTY